MKATKKSAADLKQMRLFFNFQQLDFQTSIFLAFLSHILIACIVFLWQNYYRGSISFDENLEVNILFEQDAALQPLPQSLALKSMVSPLLNDAKETTNLTKPDLLQNSQAPSITVAPKIALENHSPIKSKSEPNLQKLAQQKRENQSIYPLNNVHPVNQVNQAVQTKMAKAKKTEKAEKTEDLEKAPIKILKTKKEEAKILPKKPEKVEKVVPVEKNNIKPIVKPNDTKRNDPLDDILKQSKKMEQAAKQAQLAKARAAQKESDETERLLKNILDTRNIDKKNQYQGLGGPDGKQEQPAKINKAQGLSTGYKNSVRNLIYNNIRYSGTLEKMTTVIRIKMNQNGKIIDQQMIQSSGEPLYDKAVQAAIRRSGQLPEPEGQDGAEITLYFSPK